jgi:hypothetical protein
MLCPWCHGKGLEQPSPDQGAAAPCRECGGCGLLHCCEGLAEQPMSAPPPGASPQQERESEGPEGELYHGVKSSHV